MSRGAADGRARLVAAAVGAVLVGALVWVLVRVAPDALRPAAPRPDLLTDRVHDVVALIPFAETTGASPYAEQRFGLIHESDNRDGVACLRVPTGTSVAFHDLATEGPARLRFGAGVAWPESPPGPDPVRFRVELRREDPPPDAGAADAPGADATTPAASTREPWTPGPDVPVDEDGWALMHDEVLDPAELPDGRFAVERSLELPGTAPARWSVRFSTRRAGGTGLALPWPGFLSPRVESAGRLRTPREHEVAVARVARDLVATLDEATVVRESPELPVAAAALDAAKGWSAAGGRRTCVRAAAPSRIVYELRPPAGARLEFAVGMDTELGWKRPGDGMRFAVEVAGEEVWSRTLRAPEVVSDRGWKPASLDLSAWAGKTVEVALVTEPLDDAANDVGGWSHVVVVRRDRVPRTLVDEAPTVIVVLVDTLRADRLGAYGHPGGLTPNLDALAAGGLLFRHAQAASSWTWPSTASVLTGVPPNVHGVHDTGRSYLVDAHLTLPELFAQSGWTTAGFSSNLLIGRADNFHQGFETFVHTPYASGRAMNDRVAAWLADTDGLARFLYVHYFDPHTPYLPPPGWMLPTPEGVRPEEELAPLAQAQLAEGGEPDPALVEEYRALLLAQYDSEVRYLDHAFGELLELLREHGALDDAVLAFTSDHGEEFYEHRFFSHGGHLYEETLGVPLILAGFGRTEVPPGVVEHPVANRDLLPTLCALAGVEVPANPLLGSPLSASHEHRPVFGQTFHGHEPSRGRDFVEKLSVTAGREKLIHTPALGRTELYDRSVDPAEQRDLAGDPARAGDVERLLRDLRTWDEVTEKASSGVEVDHDPETLEFLRKLGYIDR